MTAPTATTTTPLGLSGIRRAVDAVLDGFLEHKARVAADARLPDGVAQLLRDFVFAGGKRLRPLLCVIGWHAAGGRGDRDPVIRAAASLEMFHAFALIHDDIMDGSATRRGQPTIHRALTARHSEGHTAGAADRLGASAAMLVGDLALAWADELLHTAGLEPRQLTSVLPLIDVMRTEVMYGQYLDLLTTGRPTADVDTALQVIRYKTAKYTCERPLHIGAALAGAGIPLRAALSEFALPLGEAFQLRDDLLGVFGNPEETGKPCLDDLREGKQTVLVALAMQRATPSQQGTLRSLIGCPALDEADAVRVRRLLTATGAHRAVELLIRARCEQAENALTHTLFSPSAARLLRELARAATVRSA